MSIPDNTRYLGTVACPEAIFNAYQAILEAVHSERAARAKVHLKVKYSLTYSCPSQTYLMLINMICEDNGVPWRVRTAHALIAEDKTVLVLQREQLVDLIDRDIQIPTAPYLGGIYRLMQIYSKKYNEPYIESPSRLSIYAHDIDPGKYVWIFTRIFDTWIYDDLNSDRGWVGPPCRYLP